MPGERRTEVQLLDVVHDADDGVPVGARAAEGAHLPPDGAIGVVQALERLVDHGHPRRVGAVGRREHAALARGHPEDVEEALGHHRHVRARVVALVGERLARQHRRHLGGRRRRRGAERGPDHRREAPRRSSRLGEAAPAGPVGVVGRRQATRAVNTSRVAMPGSKRVTLTMLWMTRPDTTSSANDNAISPTTRTRDSRPILRPVVPRPSSFRSGSTSPATPAGRGRGRRPAPPAR